MDSRAPLPCLLAAALVLAALPRRAASAAEPGLCGPGETSVFTCRGASRTSKTASLCVSGDPAHLRYVFGTPKRVALSYPDAGVRAADAFRHGHIMYSGIGGDYIQFDKDGYRYVVFYILGHDTDNRGVVVTHDGKNVMNLVCKAGTSDDLTTDFFKRMALPEIEDYTNFDVPQVFFKPAR